MDKYDDYVIKIMDSGSISKAAASFGITQPAMSAGLNALEKKLGYQLFDRNSIPIKLTKEGEAYIDYIYKKTTLDRSLSNKIDDIHRNDSLTISIGAPSAYVDALILPNIKEYLSLHPGSRVKIVDGSIGYLSDLLNKNSLDLFLSTSSDLSPQFEMDFFVDERICVCIPASDPINQLLGEGKPIYEKVFPIELFEDRNFIFLDRSQPLQQLVDSYMKSKAFVPRCDIRVEQVASAVRLASNGCGICFASEYSLRNLDDKAKMHTYFLPEAHFHRKLYFAKLKSRYLSSGYKDFISIIKKYVKGSAI